MKKSIISLCLTAAFMLMSCSASAQGLGGVLQSVLGSGSTTEQPASKTNDNKTTGSKTAQSGDELSGILSGVLGALGGSNADATDDGKAVSNNGVITGVLGSILDAFSTVSQDNLIGTWNFKGSAFVFESDNVLASLGSDAVAKQVANKVDTYLAKVGVKEGACSITFNDDNTCTFNVGSRGLNGTYTYDPKAKTLALAFGIVKTNAYVVYDANCINIVFQSDGLLKILKAVCAASSNSTLKLLNTLLANYDGLRVGMAFKK